MHRQELIFALFAALVALICSGWDFVVDQFYFAIDGWGKVQLWYKWLVVSGIVLFLGFVLYTVVTPIICQYGNLIMSLITQ